MLLAVALFISCMKVLTHYILAFFFLSFSTSLPSLFLFPSFLSLTLSLFLRFASSPRHFYASAASGHSTISTHPLFSALPLFCIYFLLRLSLSLNHIQPP